MPTISEGDLTFQFPSGSHVGKYDDWAFYRNQFSKIPGTKAVDFVCVHGTECWLIEVKDYRFHPRTKPTNIAHEVARKGARHTRRASSRPTQRKPRRGVHACPAGAEHESMARGFAPRTAATPVPAAPDTDRPRKCENEPSEGSERHRSSRGGRRCGKSAGSLGRRNVSHARVLDDQSTRQTVVQPGVRTK